MPNFNLRAKTIRPLVSTHAGERISERMKMTEVELLAFLKEGVYSLVRETLFELLVVVWDWKLKKPFLVVLEKKDGKDPWEIRTVFQTRELHRRKHHAVIRLMALVNAKEVYENYKAHKKTRPTCLTDINEKYELKACITTRVNGEVRTKFTRIIRSLKGEEYAKHTDLKQFLLANMIKLEPLEVPAGASVTILLTNRRTEELADMLDLQ